MARNNFFGFWLQNFTGQIERKSATLSRYETFSARKGNKMKNVEKWYNNVCIQYALGKISDRLMRKHQIKYEALTKSRK